MNNYYSEKHEKIDRRLTRYKKMFLWKLKKTHNNTLPVFIMGCGRSGTSMMVRMFEFDDRVETLAENNPKIQNNYMLIKENIEKVITNCKAPIIVSKPILNSFEASMLLQQYPLLKIIWMQRNYKDMAASSVKKFGPVVSDYMKQLVQNKRGDNWLSRGMPDETLEILRNIETSDLNHHDWMCLVWWSVNRTIIIDRLYQDNRFIFIQYEQLVLDPVSVIDSLFQRIEFTYNPKIAKYINPSSLGKGKDISIQPVVQDMCDQLTSELKTVVSSKQFNN